MKEDLLWLAVLLVFSNHCPASLLSPELFLLERNCGDALDGGLALSLARVCELIAVGCPFTWRLDPDAGGLCRRETDLCAGGRRRWCEVDGLCNQGAPHVREMVDVEVPPATCMRISEVE
jgi:hypothetical protein